MMRILQHFRRIVTSKKIAVANPTLAAIYLRRPDTVVAPPPEIMFLRRFYGFNRANGSDKIEEAANPTSAAIYLRRPDIVVAPPSEIMFLRRFYGVNSANGSDKIEEAIVVVKDLGGSVVEVDDGVSDSNNEDDDVVSEDGEVIDGEKVSKGEDLGKSDDVASRDGEGSTEIENEGEVKVSESEIGGEVKASESEMGVNGGTVNKVSLEKKQVEISTKVSLAMGCEGIDSMLLLDFLFGNLRESNSDGMEFRILLVVVSWEVNTKLYSTWGKAIILFAKREAKFDPKVGQLNIELTDFVHAIDIRVDV
ncbi:hypothetical protein Tco_1008162 [Tanacetum coccineum]